MIGIIGYGHGYVATTCVSIFVPTRCMIVVAAEVIGVRVEQLLKILTCLFSKVAQQAQSDCTLMITSMASVVSLLFGKLIVSGILATSPPMRSVRRLATPLKLSLITTSG